jgi:membrane protein DedA with SNARE-associated domain
LKEWKTAAVVFQFITHFFIELIVTMGLGYFIGKEIDSLLWEDKHLFVFILIFVGLLSSFRNLYVRSLKMFGGENKNEKKP